MARVSVRRNRFLVLVGVLCVVNAGCWATITNRSSGRDLLEPPVVARAGRSVAVERFWVNEAQRFENEVAVTADTITTSWKELPGQTDKTFELVEALRELGWEHVGATGDSEASYRVMGFYDGRSQLSPGEVLYTGVVFIAAVFAPVPLWDRIHGRIKLAIYDKAGRRVAERTTYYEMKVQGLSFWALMGAYSSGNETVATAHIASEMLDDLK